jgi:two-component system, OmpR family, phosphate regulon sensor histidine kinase PhoR
LRTEHDATHLLRSFLDIGLQLAQSFDIEKVLVTIVERSMELTGARYGAALTLSPDGEIDAFLHRGLTPQQVDVLPHLPRGRGLLGLVLSEREPVCIDHISDHPASVGFPDEHVPMAAFLGVPVQHHGELVGALYLSKSPGALPFTHEDQTLVTAMASMAAVGIQNTRLFESERQRAERSALLRAVASRVRQSLDAPHVLATTVEELGRAAGVERCFIRLNEGDVDGELGSIGAEWDATGTSPIQDDPSRQYPVSSLAAMTRSTQWSDNIATDERLSDPGLPGDMGALADRDVRAVLSTPLMWGETFLGVITFHARQPRRWSAADIELIEAAAQEVAAALHQAALYDEALKAAEGLRELDRMRSEFVSVVSHELRSPMTVVAGIADILQKRHDDLPSDARLELLETLGREARRLTRLVSDVLDLESRDRTLDSLRLQPVDLAELARESVADAGHADRTKLILEAGDATANVDRDRIKQVILNLLSNAAKFSPEQSPIALTVTPRELMVEVAVADAGPGIPKDQQHLLFQRFSRLQTSSPRPPGSGIGLYLCKTIVERHGGDIWLDSTPGQGSTFFFSLPR